MEFIDQVERNDKLAIDEGRGLGTTLREETLLLDRESAELAHPPAPANYGAEGSYVRWVNEPGNVNSLVSAKNISSVLGVHKASEYKDPPGLCTTGGD